MGVIQQRIPWNRQPTGEIVLNRSNVFGKRVLDCFTRTDRKTMVLGEVITFDPAIGAGYYPGGKGHRTNNKIFSARFDLSAQTEVTILFEFMQHASLPPAVYFEHSQNFTGNTGALQFADVQPSWSYHDVTNYKQIQGGHPGAQVKITAALRVRPGPVQSALIDLGMSFNGKPVQATAALSGAGNQGLRNDIMYFGDRSAGAPVAPSDITVGLFAVLKGFATDTELIELSKNPWQMFNP